MEKVIWFIHPVWASALQESFEMWEGNRDVGIVRVGVKRFWVRLWDKGKRQLVASREQKMANSEIMVTTGCLLQGFPEDRLISLIVQYGNETVCTYYVLRRRLLDCTMKTVNYPVHNADLSSVANRTAVRGTGLRQKTSSSTLYKNWNPFLWFIG